MKQQYRAIISSDWNECLSPCGPFDYIAFTFPELSPALDDIFQRYTSNRTTLNIRQSVPGRDIIPDDRTSSVTCHTFDTGDDTNQQNPAG